MSQRISKLSQEDLDKVAALADELGLVLKASPLPHEEKLKRFFVDGRKCRVRRGDRVWESVVRDYNPHGWFYVKNDISCYWQWKIPAYLKNYRIYTETDPFDNKYTRSFHELSKEEQTEIVNGRKMWSIEFDEWPF